MFGRHQGRTYGDILVHEPGYCRWALSVPNPGAGLRHFVRWLRRTRAGNGPDNQVHGRAGLEPMLRGRDSDSESEIPRPLPDVLPAAMAAIREALSESIFGGMGANLATMATALQEESPAQVVAPVAVTANVVIAQLPRVAFSPNLFSGNPHPDSCPVCLEDWTTVPADIVLTPCLHVFHETCLRDWISRQSACPTCRWDITDTGERHALGASACPQPSMRTRVGDSSVTVLLSDDEVDSHSGG